MHGMRVAFRKKTRHRKLLMASHLRWPETHMEHIGPFLANSETLHCGWHCSAKIDAAQHIGPVTQSVSLSIFVVHSPALPKLNQKPRPAGKYHIQL
jgi:hypothetical protein